MNTATWKIWALAAPVVAALVTAVCGDELTPRATWSVPATAQVKASLDDYLALISADEITRQKIAALWPDEAIPLEGAELLARLTASLAVADPRARAVVEHCQGPRSVGLAPKFPFLHEDQTPLLARCNLRLWYGRWLAQNDLMDEALEELKGLTPADVVDPASLLFHQALAHHRLLEKEPCLAAITKLLENEKEIPRRYATVAKLMEADLKPLKADSLDEVSRLMADVRRRLDLARAGKKVRDQEEEIVRKLEKMIDEMEKQRQQQQQQADNSGGSTPSSPLQDSTTPGMTAKGEVDQKDIGKKSGWGNLPPKQRQEVLQQIGRELPAHFRETIEEYFKRLAQDGVK
jgi:hypothetical protein